MSGESNWRPERDAYDYLNNRQRKLNVADRRPVIRRASDLVGPGIAAQATRLLDYNDMLATFNGFFSSAVGAIDAPQPGEAFVGYVVSDAELGGVQMFTSLSSGTVYRRIFNRSPLDPDTLFWGPWAAVEMV